MSHIIDQTTALDFITAGKATFTCKSLKTGNHFTYKVSAPKNVVKEEANLLFVSVLTGSDNSSDYSFFGCLRKKDGQWFFGTSPKSHISAEAPSVFAFGHILAMAKAIEQLEIWHEGKCCRCGKKLTTPTSIQFGIGPECSHKAGF